MKRISDCVVFCEGKTESLNDDTYTSGPLVSVIDGASAKNDLQYELNGELVKSGKFASHTIAEAIQGIDLNLSVREQVNYISEYLNNRILEQHPTIGYNERPSAVISAYNPLTHRIWTVGDVWYGYQIKSGEVTSVQQTIAPDTILPVMRAYVLTTLKLKGELPETLNENDPGREAIIDMLTMQGVHLNNLESPWGYGAFNGTHIPDEYIQQHTLPDDVQEIVLASDGYPVIEVDGKLILDEAERYLKDALKSDPFCISAVQATKAHKTGYKSYDDRTWFQFSIS